MSTKEIPEYLWRQITTKTGVDHREVSRNARRIACPRCHAWTLRGLDSDMCAIDARVDLVPLSPVGEVVALLANLGTWRLTRSANKWRLDPRDPETIKAVPAGTVIGGDVVPRHECGRSWPPTYLVDSNIPPPVPLILSVDPRF